MMRKFRTLKIYKKHRTSRWKVTIVPEIRLEGKWLKELGFEEGNEIQIEQHQSKLIIRTRK